MTPLSHTELAAPIGRTARALPEGAALALVVVAAASLRLFHLSFASLWGDEACMLELAKIPSAEIVRVLASPDRPDVDVAPPLYFLVLRTVSLAFGNTVTVARALSAVLGIATVLATYALGKLAFDVATARTGALLVAFSAFHVWYSQEARMYSLVTLLAVGATWAFLVLLRDGTGIPAYLLLAVAALYTQYYAYLLVAGHMAAGIALLALGRGRDAARAEERRAAMGRLAVAGAVLAAAALPWLPVVGRDLGMARQPGFPANFSPLTSVPFVLAKFLLFGNEAFVRDHLALYLLALPAGCALAIVGLAKARRDTGLLLALSIATPLALVWGASTMGAPIYKSHPFILVSPLFLLLVARGLRELRGPLHDAGLLLLVVANLFVMARLNFGDVYTKPKVRDAMTWIESRMEPGDLLLKVPAKLHTAPVETGEILSWKYHAPPELELRELKANDLSGLKRELEKLTASRHRYFLAIADTRFTDGFFDALVGEGGSNFRIADRASLPSRIRDFGLSVYLLEATPTRDVDAADREPPKGIESSS